MGVPAARPRTPEGSAAWQALRRAASAHAAWLQSPLPAGAGCCAVCRGPAAPGYLRCFHCAAHNQAAPGLLADAVVPVSYAVAGTGYAHALWAYKSPAPDRHQAGTALRAILLAFLHDHGPCVWSRARMARPTCVAVVPSGCGRPGAHPLRTLMAPCLGLSWAELVPSAGELVQARDLRGDRFAARTGLAGAAVMLLDDTWTSGSSAQSAAVALRLAGARRVAVVVLGRHLNPREPGAGLLVTALAGRPFAADSCAVHQGASSGGGQPAATRPPRQ